MLNLLNKVKLYRLKKKIGIERKHVEISSDIVMSDYKIVSFEDYIYVGPNCEIFGKGRLIISNNVIIGPHVSIYTSMHDYHSDYLPYGFEDIKGTIIIEKNVWIGANVIILPNVTIGEGAVIGAGSVVTKDVLPLQVVAGNPAKVINSRVPNEYNKLKSENKNYLKKKWG